MCAWVGDKMRHTQVDWRRQLRSVHHYPRTQAASRYGLRMLRMPGRCACGGLYAVNRSHVNVKQSKRDRLTSLGGRKLFTQASWKFLRLDIPRVGSPACLSGHPEGPQICLGSV